ERVVGGDDDDLLVAERLRGVLTERMRGLARRPAGPDHPAVLLALGEIVRGSDREECRNLVFLDLRRQRVPEVAEEDPGPHVPAIVLDERAQRRQSDVRGALTVLD